MDRFKSMGAWMTSDAAPRRAALVCLVCLIALVVSLDVTSQTIEYSFAGLFLVLFVISLVLVIAAFIVTARAMVGDRIRFSVWFTPSWAMILLFIASVGYFWLHMVFGVNTNRGFHVWPQYLVLISVAVLVVWFVGRHWWQDPSIERPDTLAERKRSARIVDALSDQKRGVFCGEIAHRRQHKSLYVSTEDRGIVIGPPGTGKTAFMLTQLFDWVEQQGSFVCLDIKPELHAIMHERLAEQGYQVHVFNPTEQQDRYNLLDDIQSAVAIGELAASLIPSDGGETKAFDEGARDIVDGIISYLKSKGESVSLPAIRDFLSTIRDEQALIRLLSESTDEDVRDIAFALARSSQNQRFMGAVFATLRSNLRFLRYDNIRRALSRSDFSLSAFLDDRPVALFLQFEERHQETTRLLLAAMASHLFTFFIEHTKRKPVLLMLDEIGNVPRIPGLVEKLNTIRSRQLPTWLYWQGLQQMQKYGVQNNEGPNAIMAACDFQMVFRLNDNDTARWFSERIGTVDRQSVSVQSHGFSAQLSEEPIAKVADLQALPAGECAALYRGLSWRNRATPYYERWPEFRKKG